MSRLPPQFGPFEPVQRLGAGGMAEAFIAVRRGPAGFEQRVCVKRILPAHEHDQDFVDAFLREARTAAQLRHNNIVQVLDFGVADDESHYLALELIDGVDLRALIKGKIGSAARLSAEIVTLIAGDLAQALDHAHRGGQAQGVIVHRDISPANVLASRAGEVKLTDFGIARALGQTRHTATGVLKGKAPYMPPEYLERGAFDAQSDLFSLGVMLYELLAGRRPFDGEHDFDTIRRIVSGEHPPLASLVPSAPPALLETIERLICQKPADRPESAIALLDSLPQIAVHKVRAQLADLVRAEVGDSATVEAAAPSIRPPSPSAPLPGQAPRAARPSGPIASETHTHERAPAPVLSRGPKLVALAAGLSLLVLGGVLALRLSGPAQDDIASKPPPVPTLPATAAQTATPAAPPPATESATAARPSAESPGSDDTDPPETGSSRNAELRIVVIPFGDVWVDDKPRGPAPVNAKLSPGSHDIAWGDGRPEERRTIRVEAGAHDNLVFRRGGVVERSE